MSAPPCSSVVAVHLAFLTALRVVIRTAPAGPSPCRTAPAGPSPCAPSHNNRAAVFQQLPRCAARRGVCVCFACSCVDAGACRRPAARHGGVPAAASAPRVVVQQQLACTAGRRGVAPRCERDGRRCRSWSRPRLRRSAASPAVLPRASVAAAAVTRCVSAGNSVSPCCGACGTRRRAASILAPRLVPVVRPCCVRAASTPGAIAVAA
jgi:hypothetical protein